MRRLDLKGYRFGKWLVLEPVTTKGHRSRWVCECFCGLRAQVETTNLRNGTSTKCTRCAGFEPGKAAKTSTYYSYLRNAQKRGIPFSLSRDELVTLCSRSCFYCDSQPSMAVHIKTCRGLFTRNGLDRVDNDKGYTMDNVVPCCWVCNRMKATLSQSEFLTHTKRIAERSS